MRIFISNLFFTSAYFFHMHVSIFLFPLREDAMAFFSPLRLGGQKIPLRAPVKSDRRSSPEGTRSFSEALLYRHSERGIIEILICERSELGIKIYQLTSEAS